MKDVVSNLFCGPTQQHKDTVPAPRTGNHFLSIQEQVSVQVTFPANRKKMKLILSCINKVPTEQVEDKPGS